MTKTDNEQHPCVKETSKTVVQVQEIAILKADKDASLPKSYRPFLLLCHTYRLLERMILNRLPPITEHSIIKEQSRFRAGKSCTSQLLNLTVYIGWIREESYH